MKLNFYLPLLDIDGSIMKEGENGILLSEILANALKIAPEGVEPLKALDWMLQLKKDGILDLDRTDQDKLKKMLNDSSCFRGMVMLVRGRLLEVFETKEK